MKLLVVFFSIVAVSLAKPGYLPGGIAALAGLAAPSVAVVGSDATNVALQNAVAEAQGVYAAAQGAAAAAEGAAASAGAAAPAPAVTAPAGVIAAAPAILAAPGLTSITHSTLSGTTFTAGPVLGAAPALGLVGPQHVPVLTAAGVPVDTPAVQAARVADAVAHLTAKAAVLG